MAAPPADRSRVGELCSSACSGSTRMKNSARLDVDVQNERKTTPHKNTHAPSLSTHDGGEQEGYTRTRPSHHQYFTFEHLPVPQDWAVSLMSHEYFITEICKRYGKIGPTAIKATFRSGDDDVDNLGLYGASLAYADRSRFMDQI